MPTYLVKTINRLDEWEGQYGPMISYYLNVETPEGRDIEVKVNKKPTSASPSVGDQLNGTLLASSNPTQPPKLKLEPPVGRPGGGGRDPKDTDAMSRSAAQDRALAYMQVKATMGVLKDDFKPDALIPIIEWFQRDVRAYQDRNDPPKVHGLPVRNAPERTGKSDIPVDDSDLPWGGEAA